MCLLRVDHIKKNTELSIFVNRVFILSHKKYRHVAYVI